MPRWVDEAVLDYSRRLPPEIKLIIKELPLADRGRDSNPAAAMLREAEAMRKAIPARDQVIALDVKGCAWSTGELAGQLLKWQMSASNYSLLIGGPDGIDEPLLAQAQQRWSLSTLTLPHPLVRVLLVEQLYRAWTINSNHPYHRA
jgi:23S rRNA (pseudouridine1915-N3)-methyltransferase